MRGLLLLVAVALLIYAAYTLADGLGQASNDFNRAANAIQQRYGPKLGQPCLLPDGTVGTMISVCTPNQP